MGVLAYSFAEVVDQVAGRQDIHSREVIGSCWVIMVAMNSEDRQPHVEVVILKVHAPASMGLR